ncbi:MAG: TIGR01620 family protein [Magnetococcales bacterium]|nr:TIGR01620 family protein [Magnetococcales bacterium]
MLRSGNWRSPVELPAPSAAPRPATPKASFENRPVVLTDPALPREPTLDPDEEPAITADAEEKIEPEIDATIDAADFVTQERTDDADTPTPRPAPDPIPAAGKPSPRERSGILFLLLMSAFLLLLLVRQMVLFLSEEWQARPLLGGVLILLAAGGLVAAMVWIGREWYRLARLRALRRLATKGASLVTRQERAGSARTLVRRITPLCQHHPEAAAGLKRLQHLLDDDTLEDAHLLRLFSRQVLAPIDAQAYRVVVSHVSNTTLITALSPLPLVDALVFLWNTLRMVRAVAQCYGVHPGTVGSWILLRDGCQGLLVAGTTDLLANHAGAILGDSLTTMLLARAGQGMANGLFIARVGLQAMRICRPLPFAAGENPGMGRLHKTMAAAIAQAFKGVMKGDPGRKEVLPG